MPVLVIAFYLFLDRKSCMLLNTQFGFGFPFPAVQIRDSSKNMLNIAGSRRCTEPATLHNRVKQEQENVEEKNNYVAWFLYWC